jgi:hypothetical protein
MAKKAADEGLTEGLLAPKRTPMFEARLTGFRDAQRVCLRESAASFVEWGKLRAAGEQAKLGPVQVRYQAIRALREKIEEASRWAWNETTLTTECDHDLTVDETITSAKFCRRCGVVVAAESHESVLEWLLDKLRKRGDSETLVAEAEARLRTRSAP